MQLMRTRLFSPSRATPTTRKCVRAHAASLDVLKMAPLGDRVLVRPPPKQEKSAGGVILAGGMEGSDTMGMGEQILTGTVVSVGEEVELEVAAGDMVMYTKYGSSDIDTEEGRVSFVTQKSILAKLS